MRHFAPLKSSAKSSVRNAKLARGRAQPFETMVRAREGRATPEEEIKAYRLAVGLYDTLLRQVRIEIHRAKSAKKRAHYAAKATTIIKFLERMDEHVEDLEEEHGLYDDNSF